MITPQLSRSKRSSGVLIITAVLALYLAVVPQYAAASQRSFGSGTCWASGASWTTDSSAYFIDTSVSVDWRPSVVAATTTWNNATSPFSFYQVMYPPVTGELFINYAPQNLNVANTYVTRSGSTLTKVHTTFNSNYSFSVGGSATTYDVQNVITHELGHWLNLADITASGCSEVTMWHSVPLNETKKRTLETQDNNAINWQYY